MSKAVVALGLSKLSVPQKIEFSRFLVTSITGNANFTTPMPALTVITGNISALETAYITAKGGGKDETAAMRAKGLVLDLSLKLLGSYVEGIANANPANAEAIILSAGINLKRQAATRPNGFRVVSGELAGQIQLRTDYDSRKMFTFAMTQTPADEATWQVIHTSTKSQHLVTGLESGIRYYFKYAKVGSEGQENWSNVLDIIAN